MEFDRKKKGGGMVLLLDLFKRSHQLPQSLDLSSIKSDNVDMKYTKRMDHLFFHLPFDTGKKAVRGMIMGRRFSASNLGSGQIAFCRTIITGK
jgi:hypothetical protein